MGIEHTPLDPSTLSAEAQRALAPGPTKMMAARGLAPIADPGQLVSVLYQLSVDESDGVASAAREAAGGLPDNILKAGLGDAGVDGRVLDFFVGLLGKDKPAVTEQVVANPAAADQTIADIAARADQATVERIGQNEQRLLRHPAIIAAMYKNRAARASTVDRAVELAIRNDIKVPDIPAWDELVQAVMQSGKRQASEPTANADAADAAFQALAEAEDGRGEIAEVDDTQVPLSELSVPQKIRLATLGNASTRAQLIRDPIRMVAMAAVKSPSIRDSEIVKFASNNSLHEDVIGYIARQREWTKLYTVKANLVRNPKCPLALSMKLMPHLREKDLRLLARSKNVPSALSAKAKKLVMTRGGRRG